MRKLQLLVLGFVALMFTACSDDDGAIVVVKKLPTAIECKGIGSEIGIKRSYKFNYDNLNRLTAYVDYEIDEPHERNVEHLINYNASGFIDTVKQYLDNELEVISDFTYSENTVTISTKYLEWDHTYTRILKLNNNLLSEIEFTNELSLNSTKYQYDTKQNITSVSMYSGDILMSVDEYSYDNKVGIFSAINTPQWFLSFLFGDYYLLLNRANNVIIEKNIGYGKDPAVFEEIITYTYDSDGYPSTASVEFENTTITYKAIK